MHELICQAGVKGMSERSELIPCNIIFLDCSAIVWIGRTSQTVGRDCTLTCDSIQWGIGCSDSAYYIYRENILQLTNSTISFRPLKLSDVGLYICTITTGGFNFTSNPTFFPLFVQRKNNS